LLAPVLEEVQKPCSGHQLAHGDEARSRFLDRLCRCGVGAVRKKLEFSSSRSGSLSF
jgi:hypothetical protein